MWGTPAHSFIGSGSKASGSLMTVALNPLLQSKFPAYTLGSREDSF